MVASESYPPRRSQEARRVLWIVLFLNLAVAVAKLGVGWAIASIAMVADGFHSLTDASSNVVGLVGIALAARPPDADHPYGHQKFETLSALAIGGFLALTAWEVLTSCLSRLVEGGGPSPTPASFAVMAGSIVVSFLVSAWEKRRGRELDSPVLLADAAHTRSDVFTSMAVLASLIATQLGYPWLDLLAALAITLLIAHAAYGILRESAQSLVDTAVVDSEAVETIALGVPGILGVHRVRTREGGYADLHVQVDPAMRLDRAHVLGHAVADRIRAQLGIHDVVVHVEPPVGHRTTWKPEEDISKDDAAGSGKPEL